jgi:hypothetical protein
LWKGKNEIRRCISWEIEYNPVYRVYKVQVKWVAVSILLRTEMNRAVQQNVQVQSFALSPKFLFPPLVLCYDKIAIFNFYPENIKSWEFFISWENVR